MNNISIKQFIKNYEKGKYNNPDTNTMIDAGWHDWFCDDAELKPRLDAMFPKVKEIAHSSKINMDTMFVFFKNNCPGIGDIYDDFRFCEMECGDVVYTIVPASGHEKSKGQASVCGRENEFKVALAEGKWDDVAIFFEPDFLTFEQALEKRNKARDRRNQFKKNDATPVGILDAEYDWGYWDAVITIMRTSDMKKISRKAVM